MHMEIPEHRLGPGVEQRQATELEVQFRPTHVDHRLARRAHHCVVERSRTKPGENIEFSRDGEHSVQIRDWQELLFACL